jgi:hypothetical protein
MAHKKRLAHTHARGMALAHWGREKGILRAEVGASEAGGGRVVVGDNGGWRGQGGVQLRRDDRFEPRWRR